MKLVYHPREFTFRHLFSEYGISPGDESTLFLLPGVSAVQEIEDRYCGEGIWGKNLLTFEELSDFLNETSPGLKKRRISGTEVLAATRKAAESVSKDLEVFGKFSDNRNFLDSAVSIVSALKQNGVSPGDLKACAAAAKSRSLRKKLSDIAVLYGKYQALAEEKGFLDDADSVRAVAEELEREGTAHFFPLAERLVVFGFSDFTLGKLEAVKALSSGLRETLVFAADFGDLEELRNSFLGRFREASIDFREDCSMMRKPAPDGPAQKEFREFRDSHEEIEYVSRTIRKLATDESRKPSDFRVLAESVRNRAGSVAAIFEKNGIAVNLRSSATLAGSPYGRLARDILRLKSSNFHRNDMIALLLNPLFALYIGKPGESQQCVNLVRNISSDRGKIRTASGVSGWKRVLKEITENYNHLSWAAGRIETAADSISSRFSRKSFASMTDDLRKTFSELRVSENSELLIKEDRISREMFDALFSFFRKLSFSYGGERDFRVSGPGEYLLFLESFMSKRAVSYKTPCGGDSERVTVTDFAAAQGTSPEFLFMIGLSDASFPSPRSADPVLRSGEKAEINRALGKRVFDPESLHYEKEKHLFLTLSSAASGKVFISCFRRNEKGGEVNRSDFFAEDPVSGSFPGQEEMFSEQDVLSRCFSSRKEWASDPGIAGILLGKYGSDIIGHLSAGVSAERKRLEPEGLYTNYEGVLSDPPPQKDAFSPTRLEAYGTCPFKYFSEKILGLSAAADPDDTRASQLDLGSLAHKVLKEVMETAFAGGRGRPDADRVMEIYEEIRKEHEKKTMAFSHLPKNLAETEKTRFFGHILPNFISEEMRRIGESGAVPELFEEEVEFRAGDFRVGGKADRVDVRNASEDGVRTVDVVDYKIGSLSEKKYFDFRNLQLPLYLNAMREQGMVPSGGFYLSVARPGETVSPRPAEELCLDEAVSLAESYVENIRKGFFPPYVGEKTAETREHLLEMSERAPCSYCDCQDLCRVKREGVLRRTEE